MLNKRDKFIFHISGFASSGIQKSCTIVLLDACRDVTNQFSKAFLGLLKQ